MRVESKKLPQTHVDPSQELELVKLPEGLFFFSFSFFKTEVYVSQHILKNRLINYVM